MSKELIHPSQFRKARIQWNDPSFQLSTEQKQDLAKLYEGGLSTYRPGSLISGKVASITNDGVLVDIGFKSDGLIPLYEFSELDLKKTTPGSTIEVILDELESADGTVLLSYEKSESR